MDRADGLKGKLGGLVCQVAFAGGRVAGVELVRLGFAGWVFLGSDPRACTFRCFRLRNLTPADVGSEPPSFAEFHDLASRSTVLVMPWPVVFLARCTAVSRRSH